MPKGTLSLPEAVKRLAKHYPAPERPPSDDAFELILWENVAYLASPSRRREAFELLRKEVGTSPAALHKAKRAALERIGAHGILKEASADKLVECARVALEECGGDVDALLEEPLAGAKRALRRFPGIGEPGAEKILLFTGRHPLLAPESNGLRVLVRLGLVRDEGSYAKTYAAARQAARALPPKAKALQEAHLLLQEHGRTLCKRSAPRCDVCPLASGCAHARARAV